MTSIHHRSVAQYPALSWRLRLAILALAVLHFIWGQGPVWQHPWDLDRSILYSYVPIPFLVALALFWVKRPSISAWLLHTFEISAYKLFLTASMLVVIWQLTPYARPTYSPPPPPPPGAAAEPRARPAGKTYQGTASVSGKVLRAGAPVRGALVYLVFADMEGDYLDTPHPGGAAQNSADVSGDVAPSEWIHDGRGLKPPVAAVAVGSPLPVRSVDGALHTLHITKPQKRWVLNYPLPAHAERTLEFDAPHGWVQVRCAVHGGREGEAHLLVLPHPHFSWTQSDGSFRFENIPAGELKAAALHPQGGQAQAALTLSEGQSATAQMELPPL